MRQEHQIIHNVLLYCFFTVTKITVALGTNLACASLSGYTCPWIAKATAKVAAYAALYGTYEGYSAWAKDIRLNSKVVNTIDKQKPECKQNEGLLLQLLVD